MQPANSDSLGLTESSSSSGSQNSPRQISPNLNTTVTHQISSAHPISSAQQISPSNQIYSQAYSQVQYYQPSYGTNILSNNLLNYRPQPTTTNSNYNPNLTGLPIITPQGYVYYAQPTASNSPTNFIQQPQQNHNSLTLTFASKRNHKLNSDRTISSESYRSNSSRKRSYKE